MNKWHINSVAYLFLIQSLASDTWNYLKCLHFFTYFSLDLFEARYTEHYNAVLGCNVVLIS